jgi:hypothetical protein
MPKKSTSARPPEYGAATGSDVARLRSDLEFIAKMLHVHVVEQRQADSFHLCEAWEVAKKYHPNSGLDLSRLPNTGKKGAS